MEEDQTTMLLTPEDFIPEEKMIDFVQEVRKVVNKLALQQYCDTPDFVLAEMLAGSLETYCLTVKMNSKYNGQDHVHYMRDLNINQGE